MQLWQIDDDVDRFIGIDPDDPLFRDFVITGATVIGREIQEDVAETAYAELVLSIIWRKRSFQIFFKCFSRNVYIKARETTIDSFPTKPVGKRDRASLDTCREFVRALVMLNPGFKRELLEEIFDLHVDRLDRAWREKWLPENRTDVSL